MIEQKICEFLLIFNESKTEFYKNIDDDNIYTLKALKIIIEIDQSIGSPRITNYNINDTIKKIRQQTFQNEIYFTLLDIFKMQVNALSSTILNDVFENIVSYKCPSDFQLITKITDSSNFQGCLKYDKLNWILDHLNNETYQNSCVKLLISIISRIDRNTKNIWLNRVWQQIWHKPNNTVLLRLCNAVKDHNDCLGEFIQNLELWKYLLNSFLNDDNSAIKTNCSLLEIFLQHLLKSEKKNLEGDVIFWDPSIASKIMENWHEFIMIIKNLKEKRPHLILPTLPSIYRFKFLPRSWRHLVIIKILQHENTQVIKWTSNFLTEKLNIEDADNENEMFRALVKMFILNTLNNTFLYSEGNLNIDTLHRFLAQLPSTIKNDLISTILTKNHSSVPFFHFVRGMSFDEDHQLIAIIDYNLKTIQNPSLRILIHEMLTQNLFLRLCDYAAKNCIAKVSNIILANCQILSKQINTWMQFFTDLLIKIGQKQFKIFVNEIKDTNYSLAMTILKYVGYETEFRFETKNFTSKILTNNLENVSAFFVFCNEKGIEIEKLNDKFLSIIDYQTLIELTYICDISNIADIYSINHEIKTMHYQLIESIDITNKKCKYDTEVYVYYNNIRVNLLQAGIHFNELRHLEITIYLLEIGPTSILSSIIEFIKITLKNYTRTDKKEAFLIQSIVERCFLEIMALRKNANFLKFIESFIQMILVKDFSDNEWTENVVLVIYKQLLENASQIHGLTNILFHNLFQQNIIDLVSWPAFVDIFIMGITDLNLITRDQRIEMETYRQYSGNDLSNCKLRSNALVGSLCIAFSYKLQSHSPNPKIKIFVEMVNSKLLDLFKNCCKKKQRYHANSSHHRYKMRIVQFLILLHSLDTDFSQKPDDILISLRNLIINGSDQVSISSLAEFFVAMNYDIDDILEMYANDWELKPSGNKSLITIIWLICCRLNDRNVSMKCINFITKFTMGQNFTVRLYAQVVIVKLIDKFRIDDPSVQTLRESVESVLVATTKNVKCFNTMIKDFCFSALDFNNLTSLDNIFHHIPRITGMPEEEFITFEMIEKVCASIDGTLYAKKDESLVKVSISIHPVESQIFIEEVYGDVQTKMVPVKTIEKDKDLIKSFPSRARKEKTNGLIVVASLVSRPPNLGGLARTCEIFGVDKFILENFKIIENKDFQALSVTSEKWLTMAEVKIFDLENYLTHMKTKGYTIIGAEQTLRSVSFCDVKFPQKTILLLGDEKEGIPANFLSLLDIAVEIPQLGVVRSLNVHVTGSLFIWEYTKQHKIRSV